MKNKLLAEFFGTFFLVFCGTGAIILNETYENSLGQFGISLAFGLSVFSMILCFGKISGTHINPAVSFSSWILKKMKFVELIVFISAQIFGAISASILLNLIFPSNLFLGATLPKFGQLSAWIWEFSMSAILIVIILLLSKSKSLLLSASVIGFVIFLEAFIGGPISGASMNPARSIAPALISGNLNDLWIYISAPILGMLLPVLFFKAFFNKKK